MPSDKKPSTFLDYEGIATDMFVTFAVLISGLSHAKLTKFKVTGGYVTHYIYFVITKKHVSINLSS